MLEDFDFPPSNEQAPPLRPAFVPLQTFATLKVTDELMIQYQNAQNLLQAILGDYEVPPNQKAQVINTITSVLGKISNIQTERYTAERLKHIENILIRVLKTLPVQAQTDFLEVYERELGTGPHQSTPRNAQQQPGIGESWSMDSRQDPA